MECPQCRHANPPNTKFCGECGTRLESLCPACQAANPPTNKFCSECGQRLGGTAGAPAPVPAATATPAAPPDPFTSPGAYTPKPPPRQIPPPKSPLGGAPKSLTAMVPDVAGLPADSQPP